MLRRIVLQATPRDAMGFVQVFVSNSLRPWICLCEDDFAERDDLLAIRLYPTIPIMMTDYAARIEAVKHPGRTCELTFATADPIWQPEEAHAWWKALVAWLRGIQLTGKPKPGPGRPRGSGQLPSTRGEFWATVDSLCEQKGKRITQQDLADFLVCNVRDIGRLCDSLEIDWKREVRNRQKSR